MMSLRLEEGLDLDEFKRRYHHAIEEVYKEALSKNLLNSFLLDFLPE